MIHMNIACAFPQCANPVIGQCIGYEGQCGRFYCAEHSLDRLCYDCGRRKLAHEEAERINADYTEAADEILHAHNRRMSGAIAVGCLLLPALGLAISLVGAAVLYQAYNDDPPDVAVQILAAVGALTTLVAMVIALVRLISRAQRMEKLQLQKESHGRPQFQVFYTEHKKGKRDEALGTVILLGAAVATAAVAGAVSESRSSHEAQVEAELSSIRTKLDRH